MKLNTLEKLHACLEHLKPEIQMDEELRVRAKEPIMRMLDWSK